MIDSLTRIHESNQDIPWSMADAPDSFINKMLPAILGIEISIDSIEGQWTLSHNQPAVNNFGVVKISNSENQNRRSTK